MNNWQNEFPQAPNLCYLNHAAVGPWPQRTLDAVNQFAQENVTHGARYYPRWNLLDQRLREQLQALINAPSADDISLLKNTSEGLSIIAQGLTWQPKDRVVISNQEFPSNRIPWEALAPLGVEVDAVDLSGEDPEATLIDALTPDVKLLSFSSVQYGTGLRVDLERLGNACKERRVLFCVDAIQSLGVIPMDVAQIHADFVVADGHKWMLGPEGLALFYCRAALREQLVLRQHGWHMIANAGDYSQKGWEPAHDGKRFECGSPNMLCAHALTASLSLILEYGVSNIQNDVEHRIAALEAGLRERQLSIITPREAQRRAGIITFQPIIEAQACYQQLMEAGVICAPRGGGIRFSPHFYTPFETLDKALDILDGISR